MIEEPENQQNSLIETLNYAQIRDTFAQELTLSSQGGDTSIPFIRNQLPHHPLVTPGDIFTTFVIGGTSGEVTQVRYEPDNSYTILNHQRIPQLPKFTTANDFFSFVADNMNEQTKAIGINFAFTLIPVMGEHSELDGIMMSGETKGHAFRGLQGERVGKAVEDYLKEIRQKEIVTTVANDTVCLIASGMEADTDRDTLVAGIVGTGYNLAIFLDENTIINLQASDFTEFTPTETGKIVDAESTNVGEQLYNKEVAGGELYKHYNLLIDSMNLGTPPLESGETLKVLAESNQGAASQVARELHHRSASLVAAQLAGLYMYKGKPKQLTCIMQGSLFWNGSEYKETVEKELLALGVPQGAIRFKKIENSDTIGAIKLVTE